jgi:hypothetical protein
MSTGHLPADANLETDSAAAGGSNGANGETRVDFVTRARAAASALPRIDKHVKAHPYTSLALACVVGAVAGAILSSRIGRALLTSVATVGAVELTRGLLRQAMAREQIATA